jgi:hypothetical protein
MSPRRNILANLFAVAVILFIVAQVLRPSLNRRPSPQEQAIAVPPQVQEILQRRCYACHSDQPRLVWFDQVVPVYWLVARDVRDARAHLNFSNLGAKPAAVQRAQLFEAVNQVQLGAMPLPRYLAAHRDAAVTADELATLKAYLAPFAAAKAPSTVDSTTSAPTATGGPGGPSPNGVPYFPDYKQWRLISTTDRGDNHTLRIVKGNDVAARAVAEHRTAPWPDGTVFAKIAVDAVDDGHGHIMPGKFVQVEFMVKDHAKYASTQGWGFARWRGNDLKPYGKDAHFDGECTGCHQPMRDNDFVYTLPLPREEAGR